jgi:pimeloyl-ACP methyl ester carboxylesterase
VVAAEGARAQLRAAAILAATLEVPVARAALERLTPGPRVAETSLAGFPTTIAAPRDRRPRPALLVLNGATPLGREEPTLARLAAALGRSGYVALVPDLPGLRDAEVTAATADAAIEVVRAASGLDAVRGGRVGLLGISTGAALALVAAAARELRERVSVVVAVAAFGDLREVTRLAVTGRYREHGRFVPFPSRPLLAVGAARSLAASLEPGRSRERLLAACRALDPDADAPLAALAAGGPEGLEPRAQAVLDLLRAETPERFDELYSALPAPARRTVERLSPLRVASEVRAPVELVSAPQDTYFPLAESLRLRDALPSARLTVTPLLAHATPALSLRTVQSLASFDAFVVRTLLALARPAPPPAARRSAGG